MQEPVAVLETGVELDAHPAVLVVVLCDVRDGVVDLLEPVVGGQGVVLENERVHAVLLVQVLHG